MTPLPLPLRLAAGLVATAVEQARDLPRLVIELPVTAISQALQTSMRIQQKVTELAIKGDRALGALRPAEESPAWARFDDDEPAARNGSSSVTELRPPRRATTSVEDELERDEPVSTASTVAARTTAAAADGAQPREAEPAAAEDVSGPNILPGYRELTIPQLRARLRKLSVDDLRVLLDWETNHGNRPPFVTMLTNRITTVTEG
jgi:hypothetical protein